MSYIYALQSIRNIFAIILNLGEKLCCCVNSSSLSCGEYFLAEKTRLCSFDRRSYEERLCEISLILDQWFWRMYWFEISFALVVILFGTGHYSNVPNKVF